MKQETYYTVEEIWDMDGGMFTMDNPDLRYIVARLLTCVPSNIVDYIIENCLVVSEWHSGKAGYIPNRFVKGKDIIILSDELLNGEEGEINETILHEFAHCWLRHKTALLENLTEEEDNKQENQATALALEWLSRLSETNLD